KKREAMDFHLARGDFDYFALTGQIVGAFTGDLDRGKLRRDLLDDAGIFTEDRLDGVGGGALVGTLRDFAFKVVRRALLAPGHWGFIDLAAIHDVGHGLGGVAERDRQHAGGKRIERAGMARLLRLEEPLDLGDGLRGAEIERLVEDKPAGNRSALGFAGSGHLYPEIIGLRRRRRLRDPVQLPANAGARRSSYNCRSSYRRGTARRACTSSAEAAGQDGPG